MTAPTGETGAPAGEESVLARVVLPTDGDLDVLPLYVDGQQVYAKE